MAKYRYPALTADAIIRYQKDKILLIRRKNPPFGRIPEKKRF